MGCRIVLYVLRLVEDRVRHLGSIDCLRDTVYCRATIQHGICSQQLVLDNDLGILHGTTCAKSSVEVFHAGGA